MSMHLVGPYMTTTNYKKRKAKQLTDTKLEALRVEWRKYNKDMRRRNMHSLQWEDFDDYVAYTQGNTPKRKTTEKAKTYAPSEPYVRNTTQYPSLSTSDSIPGACVRKETPTYTGDLIVGIGTMHKSNLVPIMRGTKQAEEIAKMRR